MNEATRVELLARRDHLARRPPRSARASRPALDEELVQDLVLGVEVVVDEAVGDARPRRRCPTRGTRGSPGGRTPGPPRRGSAGAGRPAGALRPSARTSAGCRPAVGLCPAVGERGQRGADLGLALEVELGDDVALAVGGLARAPVPTGRRSSSARRSRGAAARAELVGGEHERLVLDRAGPQQHLPVVAAGRRS